MALSLAWAISAPAGVVEGELHPWHTVSVTFDGPEVSEAYPSTFLDNRLTVTFSHAEIEYVVPGFFAADGRAGRTHATAGNQWRVRFTPDRPGEWTYRAEMITGDRVAVGAGTGNEVALGGSSGAFVVTPAKTAMDPRDFRGEGRLEYSSKGYMRFAGSGRYFLKGGAGSPENLLAFDGFDGTWDDRQRPAFPSLGDDQLHHYGPHREHWRDGDPYWTNEEGRDGKGIIGLVNYVSDAGLNSFYLMPLTYEGDGCDIWPWINPANRKTFDVSKLAQWEILFTHMQHKGIHLHLLLTETENENLFELRDGGGTFSDTRKLYYRELVARFGHHLALTWNLGEESGWDDEKGGEEGRGNSHEQRREFAAYISSLDAYNHPIKVHEIDIVEIFPQLAGYEHIDGPSLQRHHDYNEVVQEMVALGREAGRPWLVSLDEPLGWEYGLLTDAEDPSRDVPRKEVLWGTYMAGGSGVEWYFGWQNNAPTSDLSSEDMSVRAEMWRQTRIAREFFEEHVPFHEMEAANELVAGEEDNVLAKKAGPYLVYLKEGGPAALDLSDVEGEFEVRWFDPRNGGELQTGSVRTVSGGTVVPLGEPPVEVGQDWAVLVTRQ